MCMNDISTKMFLDSGNADETQAILDAGIHLDGQTTNPSLVAKNELFQKQAQQGDVTMETLFDLYKQTVIDVRDVLGEGSLSVEVYAGADSTTEELVEQGREMNTWIDGAHIKLPLTTAGLEAARILVDEGININITLCFSQEQALAVHHATTGAQPGQVFVSPFIGRLDDIGQRGSDLIQNILDMYNNLDSHVEVLAASIRSTEHLQTVIDMKTDIVTVPFDVLVDYNEGKTTMGADQSTLQEIKKIAVPQVDDWHDIDITHELTDKGLVKFKKAWDDLLN